MNDIRSELESAIDVALDEPLLSAVTKKVHDVLDDAHSRFEDNLKDYLAYNLAAWTERMAEDAIGAMLRGDDATMRKYLSCREGGYTGRDRDHPVIHGRLFETGAVELRKLVVNAHPELLKNERILDLEDQLRSLVAQVNKLERDKEELYKRLSAYE